MLRRCDDTKTTAFVRLYYRTPNPRKNITLGNIPVAGILSHSDHHFTEYNIKITLLKKQVLTFQQNLIHDFQYSLLSLLKLLHVDGSPLATNK